MCNKRNIERFKNRFTSIPEWTLTHTWGLKDWEIFRIIWASGSLKGVVPGNSSYGSKSYKKIRSTKKSYETSLQLKCPK